jgi:L,D-peptidoglycan transpeptidase YkuD (ErfK/YbiS/YcfS/YnhG family)
MVKRKYYDIIIVIDYNLNPVIKNKGSAIFLHIAKKNINQQMDVLL